MIDKIANYVLYLLLLTGLFISFSEDFAESIELYRAKKKVRVSIKLSKGREQRDGTGVKISDYISDMLTVAKGKQSIENVVVFYEVSVGLSLLFGVMSFMLMTPKVSFFAAVIGLFTPFLYYRTRLQEIRNLSSREGRILTSELLNNYKIYHFNIFEAIRISAESISEEAPHTGKLLLTLSYELNTVSTKEDVKRAVDRFKFGIDTRWADMLAADIELAQTEGVNIASALDDLITSVAKAGKAMEETKRQGSEGVRMLKYLVPVIYVLTIFASVNFFGMTINEFYYNQFKTEIGSTWFMLVCLSYIASILLVNLINKSRMDI